MVYFLLQFLFAPRPSPPRPLKVLAALLPAVRRSLAAGAVYTLKALCVDLEKILSFLGIYVFFSHFYRLTRTTYQFSLIFFLFFALISRVPLFFLFFCRFLQVFPWGAKNQNISQVFLKVAFFPSKKSRLSLKRDFPKKTRKKCTYVFGEAQGRKKT